MSNDLEKSLTVLQNAISNVITQLKSSGFDIPSRKPRALPKKISIEVIAHTSGAITYQVPDTPGTNLVSVSVDRGQQIEWHCKHPFTIYYGATSPITPAKDGRPTVPDIKAKKRNGEPYKTPETYIHKNTHDGAYKYTVSVFHRDAEVVYVDDPETIVPLPGSRDLP